MTQFLKSDSQFGVLLGAFSYFAGLTNLKWTALFLALFLSAFDHGIWIYMCLSFVFWFSGNRSLYKGEEI